MKYLSFYFILWIRISISVTTLGSTLHIILETGTLLIITQYFTRTLLNASRVLKLSDVAEDRSVISLSGTPSMETNSCSHILNWDLDCSYLIRPLLVLNRKNPSIVFSLTAVKADLASPLPLSTSGTEIRTVMPTGEPE